jgi:hypothetical protein
MKNSGYSKIWENEQNNGEDKMILSFCYCDGCGHSKTLKSLDQGNSRAGKVNFLELDTKYISEDALRKLTGNDESDTPKATAPAIKMVCYEQLT